VSGSIDSPVNIISNVNNLVKRYKEEELMKPEGEKDLFLKDFDKTWGNQQRVITEHLKDVVINNKHYFEQEDNNFVLYRGSGRSESLHRRLNHYQPEHCGQKLADAVILSFIYQWNAKRAFNGTDSVPPFESPLIPIPSVHGDDTSHVPPNAPAAAMVTHYPANSSSSSIGALVAEGPSSAQSSSSSIGALVAEGPSSAVISECSTSSHQVSVDISKNPRMIMSAFRLCNMDVMAQLSMCDKNTSVMLIESCGWQISNAPLYGPNSSANSRNFSGLKHHTIGSKMTSLTRKVADNPTSLPPPNSAVICQRLSFDDDSERTATEEAIFSFITNVKSNNWPATAKYVNNALKEQGFLLVVTAPQMKSYAQAHKDRFLEKPASKKRPRAAMETVELYGGSDAEAEPDPEPERVAGGDPPTVVALVQSNPSKFAHLAGNCSLSWNVINSHQLLALPANVKNYTKDEKELMLYVGSQSSVLDGTKSVHWGTYKSSYNYLSRRAYKEDPNVIIYERDLLTNKDSFKKFKDSVHKLLRAKRGK